MGLGIKNKQKRGGSNQQKIKKKPDMLAGMSIVTKESRCIDTIMTHLVDKSNIMLSDHKHVANLSK